MAITEVSGDDHEGTPGYADIQDLLRRLARGSSSDQGGAGAFWELPLERFLRTEIAGEPLVAREADADCCGSARPPAPGRLAGRSGLIKGLRGLPPFDGRRYPRLPFGGAAATPADIELVEAWIEAGCPGDTLEALDLDGELEPAGSIQVLGASGPLFDVLADVVGYTYAAGELRQRMDIDCMTAGQLERLRYAFRELFNLNKWPDDSRSYNNLALIHQNHCQHGWERFLPWHRVYLYEFEQGLREFCPDVTMPYWEFSSEPYGPGPEGRMDETRKAIPDALAALLTSKGLEILKKGGVPAAQVKKVKSLLDRPFATQTTFFAAVCKELGIEGKDAIDAYVKEYRRPYIDALLDGNSLWYPLRYPGQFGESTINRRVNYHYPSPNDIAQIMALRTFRDFGGGSLYNDSFGFLDQNPHNTLHIWTGGANPDYQQPQMPDDRNRAVQVSGRRFHKREDLYSQPSNGDMYSNLTASYDPIFWPVHANVDRLWWAWQQDNPHNLPQDLDGVLTPWAYTQRDTLDMHRFGYEYVKKTYVAPVGTTAAVGRFTSKAIDIPERLRKGFGKAEVRLHRVPQLVRSCFIRVFLNEPKADATTPLDRKTYAGYAAVFGHGACIGGPGHCESQPPRLGRPRDMNTPRNHRIDVTACARQLIGDGAKTLSVTLVVIGADYQEDRELLRLDGVSLNFLD
ncbi:MAG: tyrosinase family protein [Kiloniellaceae bacterium]